MRGKTVIVIPLLEVVSSGGEGRRKKKKEKKERKKKVEEEEKKALLLPKRLLPEPHGAIILRSAGARKLWSFLDCAAIIISPRRRSDDL